MRPEIFTGPLWPDIGKALAYGVPGGTVVGFILGGIYDIFGSPDLARWSMYGAGLAGTFGLALVLWPRVLG